MRPTSAEIVRTMVAGHLPATVVAEAGLKAGTEAGARLAGTGAAAAAARHPTRHATDPHGRVLLLVEDDSRLAAALGPGRGAGSADPEEVLAAVEVRDDPPVPGAPSHGVVTVAGWANPLAGSAARRAALGFAEARPDGDLLDVGRGRTLFRLDPASVVRTAWDGPTHDGPALDGPAQAGLTRSVAVEVDDYLAASPDPFAAEEAALLAGLADHHDDLLAELCRLARETALPAAERARGLRLDRYGLTLGVEADGVEHRLRAAFRQPMRARRDLAEAFGLLARCRCPRGDRPRAAG